MKRLIGNQYTFTGYLDAINSKAHITPTPLTIKSSLLSTDDSKGSCESSGTTGVSTSVSGKLRKGGELILTPLLSPRFDFKSSKVDIIEEGLMEDNGGEDIKILNSPPLRNLPIKKGETPFISEPSEGHLVSSLTKNVPSYGEECKLISRNILTEQDLTVTISPKAVKSLYKHRNESKIKDNSPEVEGTRCTNDRTFSDFTTNHNSPPLCSIPALKVDLSRALDTIGARLTTVGEQAERVLLQTAERVPLYNHQDMDKIIARKHTLLTELSRSCIMLGLAEDKEQYLMEQLRKKDLELRSLRMEDQEKISELESQLAALTMEKSSWAAKATNLHSELRSMHHDVEMSTKSSNSVALELEEWKAMVTDLKRRNEGYVDQISQLKSSVQSTQQELDDNRSAREREQKSWNLEMERMLEEQMKIKAEVDIEFNRALQQLTAAEMDRDSIRAELEVLRDINLSEKNTSETELKRLRIALSNQMEKHKHELEEKDENIFELKKEINDLRTNNQDSIQKMSELQEKSINLENQLSNVSLEKKATMDELLYLRTRIDECDVFRHESDKKANQLLENSQATCAILEQELTALRSRLVTAENERNETMNALQSSQIELSFKNSEIQRLIDSISVLENNIESEAETRRNLDSLLQSSRETNSKLLLEFEGLKTSVSDAEKSQQQRDEEYIAKIDSANDETFKLQEKVIFLTQQMAESEARFQVSLDEAKKTSEGLKEEIINSRCELEKANEERHNELMHLQQMLSDRETKYSLLEDENRLARRFADDEITRMRSEISILLDELKKKEFEIDDMERQLTLERATLKQTEVYLDEHRARTQIEVSNLAEENLALRQQIRSFEGKNSAITTQQVEMKAQIVDLQQQLGEMMQRARLISSTSDHLYSQISTIRVDLNAMKSDTYRMLEDLKDKSVQDISIIFSRASDAIQAVCKRLKVAEARAVEAEGHHQAEMAHGADKAREFSEQISNLHTDLATAMEENSYLSQKCLSLQQRIEEDEEKLNIASSDFETKINELKEEKEVALESMRRDRAHLLSSYEARLDETVRDIESNMKRMKEEFDKNMELGRRLHQKDIMDFEVLLASLREENASLKANEAILNNSILELSQLTLQQKSLLEKLESSREHLLADKGDSVRTIQSSSSMTIQSSHSEVNHEKFNSIDLMDQYLLSSQRSEESLRTLLEEKDKQLQMEMLERERLQRELASLSSPSTSQFVFDSLRDQNSELIKAVMAQSAVLREMEKREEEYTINTRKRDDYIAELELRLQSSPSLKPSLRSINTFEDISLIDKLKEAEKQISQLKFSLLSKSEELDTLTQHVEALLVNTYTPMKKETVQVSFSSPKSSAFVPVNQIKDRSEKNNLQKRSPLHEIYRKHIIVDECTRDKSSHFDTSSLQIWHERSVQLIIDLHGELSNVFMKNHSILQFGDLSILDRIIVEAYHQVIAAPWMCNRECDPLPSLPSFLNLFSVRNFIEEDSIADACCLCDENSPPKSDREYDRTSCPIARHLESSKMVVTNESSSNSTSECATHFDSASTFEDCDSVRLSLFQDSIDSAEESFWDVSTDSSSDLIDFD